MSHSIAQPAKAESLAAKVAFLSDRQAYPHAPGQVETIETNMAWVFLAGDQAFKLKKPVRHPFLDFSTPALRERDCREEVRLNRRLAPDVYLGVVAVVARPDGSLALRGESIARARAGGAARVVDWLVHMRRLPAQRMLDAAIARGSVDRRDVDRVARALSAFYAGLAPAEITPAEFVAGFAREQRANRELLTTMGEHIDRDRVARALDRVDAELGGLSAQLARRVETGHVVEGHGDLRPEHVCLQRPIAIIDCLEFNLRLRQVDPLEELSFLGLECGLAGAAWIGPRLLTRCADAVGQASPRLRAFYTAHRALLRARLALAHLLQPSPRDPSRWAPRARRYVDAALDAAQEFQQPAA